MGCNPVVHLFGIKLKAFVVVFSGLPMWLKPGSILTTKK